VPKNFDEELEKDLTFTIRGESFEMRYVRPEVIASWREEPEHKTEQEALAWLDSSVKMFLDSTNGAAKRWDTLRKRQKDPITQGQIRALLNWMVEVQSGRPTIPPSTLASGRGRTAASSTAG
jgi:hypothetical protein